MFGKKHKKKRNIILVVLFLVVAGFLLNWYLTNKLEDFLRKNLNEKIAEITDGFYKLSFDNLSIGFFNGELKIEGLDIRPDSSVYEKRMAEGNLPDIYFQINIGSIDFKGINLTWQRNYRKLHFELFEIKTPEVKIFRPYLRQQIDEEKDGDEIVQTLYERVSPFFDVVSVKFLNLENADVSYTLNDVNLPAVYALRDVNFHAYGFVLDENSYTSGKLLYSDNIDFTTNQQQQLLYNYELSLDVDSIAFNTRDSVILIRNVKLIPQKDLWEETGIKPEKIIEAKINSIDIEGIAFKRKHGMTFLHAKVFDIEAPEIEYSVTDTVEEKMQRKTTPADSVLFQSWSLYEIISPILHSLSIDRIQLDRSKFKYSSETIKGVDIYWMDEFSFGANKFLLDPATDDRPDFLYSENFAFEARGLNSYMNTKNHTLNVQHILFDTEKELFEVENVRISPISTNKQEDYIRGTIDTIKLTGLNYEDSIRANRLVIDSPNLQYYRYWKKKREADVQLEVYPDTIPHPTVLDLFASSYKSFSINDIYINNGKFGFNNRSRNDAATYSASRLDFHAKDFIINDDTRKHNDWYFDCSDFDFTVYAFSNYLPGRTHHLSIKKGFFTGIGGKLEFSDIKLTPQEDTQKSLPDTYMSFQIPSVKLDGIDLTQKRIGAKSFIVHVPQVKIVRERIPSGKNAGEKSSSLKQEIYLPVFYIGDMILEKADFQYIDRVNNDSLNSIFEMLDIKGVVWDNDSGKNIIINSIAVNNPEIDYIQHEKKGKSTDSSNSTSLSTCFFEKLSINDFDITSLKLNMLSLDKKLNFDLKDISFSDLDWKFYGDDSYFNLDRFKVADPVINLHLSGEEDEKENSDEFDIYNALKSFSNKISINHLDIENTTLDYVYQAESRKLIERSLKNINAGFTGLKIDNTVNSFKTIDLWLNTPHVSIPIANGFYTIEIGNVKISDRGERLSIDSLHMVSQYPKMEFAYRHPTHKDWFDLTLGKTKITGIDLPYYFSDNILKIEDVQIRNGQLGNFKNQQIEIEHNIMPMIYETLQKAPLKFDVGNMNVKNFSVIYEELAKKATEPGKIFFTGMDGHISGLTNIVKHPQQYTRLDATGNFMGEAPFNAIWKVPVDSLNDRFILHAHVRPFDLRALNHIFTPLVNAEVVKGTSNDVKIDMDASSLGGHIGMLFLYNDLKVSILKEKDGETVTNSFISGLANAVIRSNNPNNRWRKPRNSDIYVERDAYHSTFNYMWQMLQPALGESVGISQKTQNFFKSIPANLKKLADFFWPEREHLSNSQGEDKE